MERKTEITADEGRQDLLITREFDLPVDLLFKAFTEPECVEQWMGTKVLKLECVKHGSYQFESSDPKGNKYRFNGAIYEVVPEGKITRTFEFEGMPFGVQLELMEFEALTGGTSRLRIHTLFESAAQRDQMMQMGFSQGINMAHKRLQEVMGKLTKAS